MLSFLFASAVLLNAGSLGVQTASIDISPTEPLPLGGYTERMGKLNVPGGDPLFARAIVFSVGNQKVVVMSAEMLTIPESLVREVRAKLPKDIHLFMAATHTHCAPDSQMLNDQMTLSIPGISNYKRKQLDRYADLLSQCVLQASSSTQKVVQKLYIQSRHVSLTHARRPQDFPDDTFTVLSTDAPLISHYAAHPVFYDESELQTRGDWPGVLAQRGGLVLQGAIGDVSPNLDKRPASEQILEFVSRLTESLRNAPKEALTPRLGWAEVPIKLDPKKPHPSFAKVYKVPDALARLAVMKFAPSSASISAMRIGKLAIVGIPGEPTASIGRKIRDEGRRIGFSYVLVTSHVNGWIGYILEPDDYDRGGYEATLSMHGNRTGERVIDAAVQALRELSSAKDR
jgi:hypothetical protein